VGPGSVTINGGGHILTFTSKTGKWDDLDLNAILNTPAGGGEGGAAPEK